MDGKGPWLCELSGDNCMRLEVFFDTMVNSETAQLVSDLYTDSLAAWSREIFFDEQQAKVSFHCHRQSHRHCHLRVQGGLARYHHIRQTLAPRHHPLRRDAAAREILFRGQPMEKERIALRKKWIILSTH